jgi:hypothetical protein
LKYDADTGFYQNAPLADAAQDSTGKIWGLLQPRLGGQQSAALVFWNGVGWTYVPPPANVAGNPVKLTASPSGAVLCAWSPADDSGIAITAHRGNFGRLLGTITLPAAVAPFNAAVPRSGLSCLYADQASAWAVTVQGAFYRVDLDPKIGKKITNVYRIANSAYFPGYIKTLKGDPFAYAPWHAVTDGQGHTWFYTSQSRGIADASLRGVLIWNGQTMVSIPQIVGVAENPITTVAPKDRDHVWLATQNGAFYTVDDHQVTATPEASSPDKPQQPVEAVLNANGTWLVVTGTSRLGSSANFPLGTSGTLWRYAAPNWTLVARGIDRSNAVNGFGQRAFAIADADVWVGSRGNDAWIFPVNGGPIKHIDWTYGFPLLGVDRIFHTTQQLGGLIAIELTGTNSAKYGTATHCEKYVAARPLNAVKTFALEQPLVQDSHGHLWGVFSGPPPGAAVADNANAAAGKPMLQEWDGKTWTAHALPGTFATTYFQSISADTKDHIWLILAPALRRTQNTVFVYVPEKGTYNIYRDFDGALAAAAQQFVADRKNDPATPTFKMGDLTNGMTPNFSEDGQCGYQSMFNQPGIHLYDGRTWHIFTQQDVTGKPGTFRFDGPPFFDSNNVACVNSTIRLAIVMRNGVLQVPNDAVTWQWVNHTTWQSKPYVASATDNLQFRRMSFGKRPQGCPVSDDGLYIGDKNGDYWMIHNQALCRFHGGKVEPAISADLASPYVDGRAILTVLIDSAGNAFVVSQVSSIYEYVIVPTTAGAD